MDEADIKTYKVVIVEDNPDNTAVLCKIINENHPDLEIVGLANTVELAIDVLRSRQPHIALMDIELTPGTSFDVIVALNQMQPIDFEIIFITAHQRYDYATRAIDLSSLAFLTKPVDPELLAITLKKAEEKQTQKIQIDHLLSKLQQLDDRDMQIIIPTQKNTKMAVSIADICYFEADGQTTIVHFRDKTTLQAFRILGHFKKMLMEEYPFFIVHNKILLNVTQVQSYEYSKLKITLKNGAVIVASRRFGKDFNKRWREFNKENGFLNNIKRWFGVK